jgi:hypothetical protein
MTYRDGSTSRSGTNSMMRIVRLFVFLAAVMAPHVATAQSSYLFVWAGGSGPAASDFVATIDANPASRSYGRVVASVPTGSLGMPHHTEQELGPNGHLLANDFPAGRTWLFDLHDPLKPRIITSFGDVAGFSHPHTFSRLANGHVLTTFQYRADATTEKQMRSPTGGMAGMTSSLPNVTGGLVEMDERGKPLMSASAADPSIKDHFIYPYSVLPMPGIDRAVSTTTDMNPGDTVATSQWVQIWRLSDLKLLRTIALPPGSGTHIKANEFTGEPRLLADGRSVYIHTFNCGLYLLSNVAGSAPAAKLVHAFDGSDCGVPVLTSHYWIQTVPADHGLVTLDVSDPEHPREVSRVSVGAGEQPHWIAIDHTGRRIVLNSGGKGNRLFIINFDPANGRMAVDSAFRDSGNSKPGISLAGANWPHGFNGNVVPHGVVFSR